MTEIEYWAPSRIMAALNNGEIVLIDVHTPQEYMIEHIKDEPLMPMAFYDVGALPSHEDKHVVLH